MDVDCETREMDDGEDNDDDRDGEEEADEEGGNANTDDDDGRSRGLGASPLMPERFVSCPRSDSPKELDCGGSCGCGGGCGDPRRCWSSASCDSRRTFLYLSEIDSTNRHES